MASLDFGLHGEGGEDQGCLAGTERAPAGQTPRVEVEQGVGIDSEAVLPNQSPDEFVGAGGEIARLAPSVTVDQRALARQHRQGSPPPR